MRPSRSLRRARRRAPSRSSSLVFTLAASLSRSLSISFLLSFLAYLLSFSTPAFFSLAHPRPPYAVPSRSLLSRSSLLPSPFPFVSARPPLLSRVVVPLSKPLFPPRYITTLPRLVRSSSNSPPARRFATARIFAFFSLAPSIPSGAPSLSLFVPKLLSLFFPPFLSPVSPPFSLALFFALPVCFLSPTNAFSLDVYVSSGVWYAGRTSYKRAGAYVCAQAVLLAPVSRRGETRVFESLRYAFMGKKKWADVSSALVTAACKYAAAEGARTRHACTGSVEELLPFLSASFLYRPGFSNIFARYPLRRGI